MAIQLWLIVSLAALGSSEYPEHIKSAEENCSGKDRYRCHDASCVSRLAVCDGYLDCPLGEDEDFCNNTKVETKSCEMENKFMCYDSSKCVPWGQVCNDVRDCADGSDEARCDHNLPSPTNTSCHGFECKNGECISRHWVCDGQVDCSDRSDEGNQSCFHRWNFNHTKDLSVQLCPDTDKLDDTMFYCRDRSYCLHESDLCNGVKDCRDGSDEAAFCANYTTACKNVECEESCKPTPHGARCRCGQVSVSVNKECSTVNYCDTLPSACSQLCDNNIGKYTCSCDDGYRAIENMCYANEGDPIMFYTTRKEIKQYNIKAGTTLLLTTADHPRSVASDGKNIYWIETSQGNFIVMKASLSDVNQTKEVLLGIGLDTPDGIAIDWVGRNLYLTESKHSFIAACSLSGGVCARIRDHNGIRHPKHIAVDPYHGIMYWADYIGMPRIQRANMDGTNVYTFTLNSVYPPSALTLDLPNRKMYWAEKDVGITVINLDGTGKYEFVAQFIYAPNTLAIFENDLYWDDHTTQTMQSNSKMEGPARRKELFKLHVPITSMSIYHPLLHNMKRSPCNNSLCSDMCVPSGGRTYSCICGEDATLASNKLTCIKHATQQFIVVGGDTRISKFYFHALTKPEQETTLLDVGRIQALAYNPLEDVVYVYDGVRKVVYQLHMNKFQEGARQMLLLFGLHDIVDMDFDYITGNLYYLNVSPLQSSIEVLTIHNGGQSLVYQLQDGEVPVGMCVIPEYGTMMVVYLLEGYMKVDRFGLDGGNRLNVYKSKFAGKKIMVRYSREEDFVFISDPDKGDILQIHPEGTGKEKFRWVATNVHALAAGHNILFWAGKQSQRLFWSYIDDDRGTWGSMLLNKFPEHTQLHMVSIEPPVARAPHPCANGAFRCPNACVQTEHAHDPNTKDAYRCLCPAGEFLQNNTCIMKIHCIFGTLSCYESNSCYDRERACNGVADCPNGEDERDCPNSSKCGPSDHNCPNTTICVTPQQLCDGRSDCPDDSDEGFRFCPIRPCTAEEFMCTNGLCIMQTWMCDGEYDCPDGADEKKCATGTCDLNKFRCGDGKCIDIKRRCDGSRDCADQSDEVGCEEEEIIPKEVGCVDNQYMCPTHTSTCIPYTSRCDGVDDCPDGADEMGCSDFTCGLGYFQCLRWQQCVPDSSVCDGTKDCDDGSDENKDSCIYRQKVPAGAPSVHVSCDSGLRCDQNTTCIDWSSVCNGIKDCTDGTDEGGICESACSMRPCHHICHRTPRGPHCSCFGGYTLNTLNNQCRDVDECQYDICSHACTNVVGSYLCSCHPGYALRSDKHSCKLKSGNITFLYVSEMGLTAVRPHEGQTNIIYSDAADASMTNLDYDPITNVTYFTNGKEVVVIEKDKVRKLMDVGAPTWVGADWITGNIYIIDETPKSQVLRVCNIQKEKCAKMHHISDEIKVTSLEVDPINRRIIYCGRNLVLNTSFIFMANLTGGNATVLGHVQDCTGLAVDYYKHIMYVAQANGRLMRLRYNGIKSADLVTADYNLQSPLGLQLLEDHIFSFDNASRKFSRCLTFSFKRCEAYFYIDTKAKSFIIKHDHVEHSEAEEHCRCESHTCEEKPECRCYNLKPDTADDLCLNIASSEFYSILQSSSNESWSLESIWVLSMAIFVVLTCSICLYFWRYQTECMKNVFCNQYFVHSQLVDQHPPIVPIPWSSRGDPLLPGMDPEHQLLADDVQIHVPADSQEPIIRPRGFRNSFVNRLYSSVCKPSRRRQEPKVSVRLARPMDPGSTEQAVGGEPQDISSDTSPAHKKSSPAAPDASDTESDQDIKEQR